MPFRTLTRQPATDRLFCNERAQMGEQIRFGDRLLQEGRALDRRHRAKSERSGQHDNGYPLLAQPRDQARDSSPPRRWKSTSATSGRCAANRLSASAVFTAGPSTRAPQSSSSIFTAWPTSRESRPIGYRAPSARRLIRRPRPDDRSSHPSVVRRNGISHLGSITKGEIRASKQRQTTPQQFWLGVTFLHQTGVGPASPGLSRGF